MLKNFLVYYMSGTGNSYRAAKWAEEKAGQYEIKTTVIPVNKAVPKNDFQKGKNNMIGIFFPTHGFTAPWPVIKLALLLPFGSGTKVFVSVCRAGWMLGPLHLPGLEGTATLLIAVILWIKGYDVRGFWGLDMPSNWLAVHWGLKKENAMWFIRRAEKKTKDFTEKIFGGKRVYRGVVFIIIGILLSYISLMYLLVGRLALAKIMFADFNCNSCGICWNNCPFGAIKPVGKKNPKPFWTFKCESCERCIAYCPRKAIQTGFLYIFLLYWFIYGVIGYVPILFFKYAETNNFLSWISSGVPFKAANILYMLLWVFIGYFILFWSSRIEFINRIYTYTTPTKLFRRYHEPGTRLKDMQ